MASQLPTTRPPPQSPNPGQALFVLALGCGRLLEAWKWPVVVMFTVWVLRPMFVALAGVETKVGLVLPQIAAIAEAFGSWLVWALGTALVVVGAAFAVLFLVYRSTTARLGAQIRELEQRFDPTRKSSGLEVDGSTGRKDR